MFVLNSKLKRIVSKIIALLILIFSVACGNDGRIENTISRMKSIPVVIPIENMVRCQRNFGQDTIPTCNFRMIVYTDQSKCSSCFIKHLSVWEKYLELERDGKVGFYFIIEVPKTELDYYRKQLKYSHMNHPVYFDVDTLFKSENPHLPNEEMYHVFLVDGNNKIVMVGNPVSNLRIEEIFYKIVNGKSS